MDEKTCKGCKHFHKGAASVIIGQPSMGECRGAPPEVVAVPSQKGLAFQAMHRPVTEAFPACGFYEQREE